MQMPQATEIHPKAVKHLMHRVEPEDNLQKQPEMVVIIHRVEPEDNLLKCHQVKVVRLLETVAETHPVQVM